MAADPKLLTAVLQRSIAALFTLQRLRARHLGVVGPMPAALTAIQRFGSAVTGAVSGLARATEPVLTDFFSGCGRS